MKTPFTNAFRFSPFLLISVLISVLPANAQVYSWVKHYDGASHIYSKKLAAAPSGDNYTTAEFKGTITINGQIFEESSSGQLLIKHDAAGMLKWVLPMKKVGISAIKATDSHVYLAGSYNKSGAYIGSHSFPAIGELFDGYVIRLTENGTVDLVVMLHGTDIHLNNAIQDLDVDAKGRMYITGQAGKNAVLAGDTLQNDGRPMYIARLETDGSMGWVTTSNAAGGLRITTSEHASKIFVSAQVEDATIATFDNSPITYVHTSDGNPYGGYFLLSCDNNGVVLKTKMIVSSSFRIGVPQIALSPGNELYLVMNTQYDNIHLFRYDTLMNKIWDFREPDTEAAAHSIAVDIAGNLLMAGSVRGEATFSGTQFSGPGNYSGYVAKYDNHGNLIWITGALNNTPGDGAAFFGVDTDNLTDVYISGQLSVPVIYPGFAHHDPETPGMSEIYVARIEGQSDYESLSAFSNGALRLFPTVNQGNFNVELRNNHAVTCGISDINGRTVFTTPLDGQRHSHTIGCTLSNGFYFVRVQLGDGSVLQAKMVVRND